MKILVFNCGSSSIKYQLISMESIHLESIVIASGIMERIGLDDSLLKHVSGEEKFKFPVKIETHKQGIALVIEKLIGGETKVLESVSEIEAIGHRVVHGGEAFSESVLIDDNVMEAIKDVIPLAPLHNPAHIMGIEACQELMPEKPQVAVFDTAFHQSMPEYAYLYALPYEYYEKYGIRCYGFHGTSHKYVSSRAAEAVETPIEDLKIITCHLGNGASIAAINGGKVLTTSMGFTPLSGLVMGTRSGDMDPAIPIFLMRTEGFSADEVDNILNKESGVKGISGVSSDMRDVEDAAFKNGDKQAQLALDMYHFQIVKYIGAYAAALNGVDLIIFTGGVGENGSETREEILSRITYLGLEIDKEKNKVRGKRQEITKKGSKVRAFVMPTNEELAIARDTKVIVDSLK